MDAKYANYETYLSLDAAKELSPEEIASIKEAREAILDLSQKEFAKEASLKQVLINIESALVKTGNLDQTEITFSEGSE